MAWTFPENLLFEIETVDGKYLAGCRFIQSDKNHLTVDYTGQLGTMIRIQLLVSDIRTLTYAPPSPSDVLRHNGITVDVESKESE